MGHIGDRFRTLWDRFGTDWDRFLEASGAFFVMKLLVDGRFRKKVFLAIFGKPEQVFFAKIAKKLAPPPFFVYGVLMLFKSLLTGLTCAEDSLVTYCSCGSSLPTGTFISTGISGSD